jgi:hypothetical protein
MTGRPVRRCISGSGLMAGGRICQAWEDQRRFDDGVSIAAHFERDYQSCENILFRCLKRQSQVG